MVAWESRGQTLAWEGLKMIPPPLAVRPELTADDVAWLNDQMALTERPPVRYARELPVPALPSGAALRPPTGRGTHVMSTQMAPDYEPPSMSLLPQPASDASWIAMTEVRG